MPKVTKNKKEEKQSRFNSEWLQKFRGFENYSNEEANRTIKQLEMFADVVCRHFMNTS